MIETQNGKQQETWKTSIESAKEHFNAAFQELGQAASDAKALSREAWRQAQVKARATWADVREEGKARLEEGKIRSQELLEEGEAYVQKKPLQAVALSAIVGLVIGIYLSSGKRKGS